MNFRLKNYFFKIDRKGDNLKTLKIKDFINSDLATSSEDAAEVFKYLKKMFAQKEIVQIDFSGLNTITTAFLNASIGDLYSIATRDQLNRYIRILGNTLTPLQRNKVAMVMDNARNKLTQEELEEG